MNIPDATAQAEIASTFPGVKVLIHPQFEDLLQCIENLRIMTRMVREPRGLAVKGGAGVGKTELIATYTKDFKPYETKAGTVYPVFVTTVPSPATINDLISYMLQSLGDPEPFKGTRPTKAVRLKQLLIDCMVELLILDEFHHLVEADTETVRKQVSEWLKWLLKAVGVPFVVVGMEQGVDRVIKSNKQLASLIIYPNKILKPFKWDETNGVTMRDFDTLIEHMETQIGFQIQVSPSFTRVEALRRLHYATEGTMRNIVDLFAYLYVLACFNKMTGLDYEVLQYAVSEILVERLSLTVNPFGSEFECITFYPSPEDQASRCAELAVYKPGKAPSLNRLLST